MSYDSTEDTLEHIEKVSTNIYIVMHYLTNRAEVHDKSKLESPEKEVFDRITPKLREVAYGTDEYRKIIREELSVGIKHHYEMNDHHPEHFPDGIIGMSLLAIIEMVADWKAANERVGGNFRESLEINRKRFKISDELFSIILNTCEEMRWI